MRLVLLKFLTQLGRFWLRSHGVKIGRGGWVHGLPEVRLKKGAVIEIGNDVTLCSLSRFNPLAPRRKLSLVTNTPGARIILQDGAGISNSVLSCYQRITIGRNTLVGAECLIVDSDFHGLPLGEDKPIRSAPVTIGDNVFIGARTIILKGVNIGNKSVIGAGSVVTSDIPENCVAAGNPARVVRSFAPAEKPTALPAE
jgi:acetyltransferase-like isoleucine patch superfamily enzyme